MKETQASFRILNIKALIADFQQGQVDEPLRFKYLLVTYLLLTLAVSLTVQVPPEDGLVWLLNTAVFLVAVITGTVYSYRQNKQGDNVDFLARYIAVNFVVSMRFFVAYVILFIALVLLFPLLEGTAFMDVLGVDIVLNLVLYTIVCALYYYFVVTYIRQIAQPTPPQSTSSA